MRVKFDKPISLGVLIAAEQAWKIIAANDKLLNAGKITKEEWFRRRDELAAKLKARAKAMECP